MMIESTSVPMNTIITAHIPVNVNEAYGTTIPLDTNQAYGTTIPTWLMALPFP